jgi:hypothetical protein
VKSGGPATGRQITVSGNVFPAGAVRNRSVSHTRQKRKMKISIILAHPNKGSFNHAIAYAAAEELRANCHEVNSTIYTRRNLIRFYRAAK